MKKLNLSRNPIGNIGMASLADCIHNIEELEAVGCRVGPAGVERLAKKIYDLIEPVSETGL